MSLFEGIVEQANDLARRVHKNREHAGPPIVITGGKEKSWLVHELAQSLGKESVIVRVPRDLDKTAYVLLAASAQCGPEPLRETALQLAAHQADPSQALDALGKALGSRLLLVDNIDAIEGYATDAELRDVFEPTSKIVSKWLKARASVVTCASSPDDSIEAHVGGPHRNQFWDTQRIWKLVGGDVELYTLAATRALLLDVRAEEPSLEWNRASVVGDIWEGMPNDLRDLVGLLAVHGRALADEHVAALGRGANFAFGLGCASLLLESSRGMVQLTSTSSWLGLLSTSARRAAHQRLAGVFANAAREAASPELAPLAVLEAHRHYAAIPDIEQASKFARFGVATLLGTAKELSMDARQEAKLYGRAARVYELVLTLDQQVRDQGDRDGIGSRARAYAVHYRAYNRYKAHLANPFETLSAYREALSVWRENALFWSRTISCCFVADRYEEGVRARDEAFAAVPQHARRDWYLISRTTEHLLRGDRVLAALLTWRDYQPSTQVGWELGGELLRRAAEGWTERHLWAPGIPPLVFRQPVLVQIIRAVDRLYACQLLETVASGSSPEAALRAAMVTLTNELMNLLEDPEPSPERALRKKELLRHLDFDAMRPVSEQARWAAYLASLDALVAAGDVTMDQARAFLLIWRRARRQLPELRRPAAGRSDEGRLSLSWSFADIKGVTFTIDIERDGRVDWFYRNGPQGKVRGTADEPEDELPEEALQLLEAFAS